MPQLRMNQRSLSGSVLLVGSQTLVKSSADQIDLSVNSTRPRFAYVYVLRIDSVDRKSLVPLMPPPKRHRVVRLTPDTCCCVLQVSPSSTGPLPPSIPVY